MDCKPYDSCDPAFAGTGAAISCRFIKGARAAMSNLDALTLCLGFTLFQGFILWRTSRNLELLGELLRAILNKSNGDE